VSQGDKWMLPGGHEAIEVSGSTRTTLRVCVIKPHWPFPTPPREVARDLCQPLPMRYYGGATVGEALL
jgi:hypothetical protein